MITEELFIKALGRKPIQDDLERVNCLKAGQMGHECCGWNKARNCPMFEDRKTWPKDTTYFKFKVGEATWEEIQWVSNGSCPRGFYDTVTFPKKRERGMYLTYYSPQNGCAFELVSAKLGKKIEAFDFTENK